MQAPKSKVYFFTSIIFHIILLSIFIASFELAAPLPVIENTNKNDTLSAVLLGDTPKSKIVPQKLSAPPETPPPIKETPKEQVQPKKVETKPIEKDVIALKALEKKKLAKEKALEEKKRRDLLAKELLADIKKQNEKQKKIKQTKLKSQFEKTLHDQAEKSLRQQLLNEKIKLQGKEMRQSQGEVNKYKALILQAISEHWIIPTQADKKRYCELMIHLAPGGMVLDVQVTKTSGDPALDSSARAAVLKASPLPVPNDHEAFEAFRRFVLKVKPENIVASGDRSPL